jgi:spermidine synthase
MAVCSDTLDATAPTAAQVRERLQARGVGDLQYYNPAVHGALFALPNYYAQLGAPA